MEKLGTVNGIGTTLYGKAKKGDLPANERVEAEQQGYQPFTYQAVKWFTFFFVPVIPLGTFRVLEKKRSFVSSEPATFKMWKVEWDWAQVIRHYFVGVGLPILVFSGLMYVLTR